MRCFLDTWIFVMVANTYNKFHKLQIGVFPNIHIFIGDACYFIWPGTTLKQNITPETY